MIPKKINSLIFLALLISFNVFSQQFGNSADLGTVDRDSFYSIPITPELSSYLKTDLSDIRIVDEKGKWVPHINNWSLKNTKVHNVLYDSPILKKENARTSTILITENIGKENFSNIILVIKNTAASRLAVISGSDDQKNWFTITDSIQLSSVETIPGNKPAFRINFPIVNYNYFKITIYNGNKDPFNIQEVLSEGPGDPGIKETYMANPPLKFTQKDTFGFSLVRIESPVAYPFRGFTIDIASPKYYDRRVKLYSNAPGEFVIDFIRARSYQEYIFSAGNNGNYEIPELKIKTFYLLIENGDNPPLQISSVNTEQISKELIAYLEKGKHYKLLFNDSVATIPDYDLQKFHDRIPGILPILNAGKIFVIDKTVRHTSKANDKKQWLWPAIIIILLLLGYFTWSLTKDLKKRNNTE